jgi:hypothetical protein
MTLQCTMLSSGYIHTHIIFDTKSIQTFKYMYVCMPISSFHQWWFLETGNPLISLVLSMLHGTMCLNQCVVTVPHSLTICLLAKLTICSITGLCITTQRKAFLDCFPPSAQKQPQLRGKVALVARDLGLCTGCIARKCSTSFKIMMIPSSCAAHR